MQTGVVFKFGKQVWKTSLKNEFEKQWFTEKKNTFKVTVERSTDADFQNSTFISG